LAIWNLCRLSWDHLCASGRGRIIVLVSMSGKRSKGDLAAYSSSKFALMGLCQTMKNKGWDKNIRITAICPSWVNTKMAQNISSLANSCGADAKVIFREITPPVNNNSEINRVLRDSGIKVLGQENVIELQKPSLGAEDFAEFLKDIPGAMFRLGVSSSNGCAPLHSSKFDPDERAIAVGIKVITESIVKLNNKKINAVHK